MRILVKTIAGSHLFGTNTETSDMDYKGVYLPTKREILIGNYSDVRSQSTGSENDKNTKDDVDVEFYSLKKFFKMLNRGDTAALELLFTPDELIVEKDPLWDNLVARREEFLSSKINAMIGYARQQANKYGTKGVRMNELGKAIEILKEMQSKFDFKNPKLKHAWTEIQEAFKDFKHIEFTTLPVSETESHPAVNILGKKYDFHVAFTYILQSLKTVYKGYGARAREAKKNNGIDWKALSHAARISFQGVELLTEHKITLPLREVERQQVLSIKKGEVDHKEVSKMLEENLAKLEDLRETSSLPKQLDQEKLDDILVDIYMRII